MDFNKRGSLMSISVSYNNLDEIKRLAKDAKINMFIDIECQKYKIFETKLANSCMNKIMCWLSGSTVNQVNNELKNRKIKYLPSFVKNQILWIEQDRSRYKYRLDELLSTISLAEKSNKKGFKEIVISDVTLNILKKYKTPNEMTYLTNVINAFSDNYYFLSNFDASDVEMDGKIYSTVEHAYQAAKSLDEDERERIRTAPTPGVAKKLGRKVALRADWEEVKLTIMEDLLRKKFSNDNLKEKLLATKGMLLIEGNYWGDSFWGVDHKKGGQNHLGKLLMKIRDEMV